VEGMFDSINHILQLYFATDTLL